MGHMTLKWHVGEDDASGNVQAHFQWLQKGKVVRSGAFTKEQLDAEIQKLEDMEMKVPPEFFDALLELKRR